MPVEELERGHRAQIRNDAPEFPLRNRAQILDAVLPGTPVDGLKTFGLGFIRGHDQFATAPVRHAARLAKFIKHPAARHAVLCLQRAGVVVDPCMDYLGIARACLLAKGSVFFEDQWLAPGQRQCAGDGKADYPRTDDNSIRFKDFHIGPSAFQHQLAIRQTAPEVIQNILRRKG